MVRLAFTHQTFPSRFPHPTHSLMPCCGTPVSEGGPGDKNRSYPQYPQQSPINNQPGPQSSPGWNEKPYQPPAIPSPPPTHYSHGLSHSPPPANLGSSYPQSTFNASSLSGTTYQASSITRPPPSLPPSPPPVGGYGPVSTVSPPPQKKGYTIPTDEGKLSVSIDFGSSSPSYQPCLIRYPDGLIV